MADLERFGFSQDRYGFARQEAARSRHPCRPAALINALRRRIADIADLPDRTFDLLFRFLRQNGGALSRRARDNAFATLDADGIARIEDRYADIFLA